MAFAVQKSSIDFVEKQYHDYPYPHRNPQDERERFLFTNIDDLATINHYCFRGQKDWQKGFRALVAGGGTGDSTIHLAEQMRELDGELVHLDLSQPSIEIAKERAQIRNLKNIRWIQGSLLDLDSLDLGKFDYINCVGVLHHLPDPAEGLAKLRAVLNEEAAIGLMFYGKYGRTGVYQVQDLLKSIAKGEENIENRIQLARQVLEILPESNWFRRGEKMYDDVKTMKDAEILDLFLHKIDRAFSILELYELLQQNDLTLAEFLPRTRPFYDPKMAFTDAEVLERVRHLPHEQQQSCTELFWGTIKTHDFWASTVSDSMADFHDTENIPFFSRVAEITNAAESIRTHLEDHWSMKVELTGGIALHLELDLNPVSRGFVELVDNTQSVAEILNRLSTEFADDYSPDEIREICNTVFECFRSHDMMLLRGRHTIKLSTR